MKTLRINLHIRDDVAPRLYVALAVMPPRPRAELLRKLAELGLQIESGQLHSLRVDSNHLKAPSAEASAVEVADNATEGFGNDLAGLVGNTF